MGSFDMTCAVSGLPIGCGDPVRYLLLCHGPYHRPGKSAVYTTDEWHPLTPALETTYDDYGRIGDLAPTFMRRAWRAHLRKIVVSRPLGDNSCHDVAVHRGSTVRQMLEAASEGRLRVRQRRAFDPRSGVHRYLEEIKRQNGEAVEEKLATAKGPPATIPTWRRVRRILRDANLAAEYRAFPIGYARVMVACVGYGEFSKRAEVAGAMAAAGFVTQPQERPYEKGVVVMPVDYRAAAADRAAVADHAAHRSRSSPRGRGGVHPRGRVAIAARREIGDGLAVGNREGREVHVASRPAPARVEVHAFHGGSAVLFLRARHVPCRA